MNDGKRATAGAAAMLDDHITPGGGPPECRWDREGPAARSAYIKEASQSGMKGLSSFAVSQMTERLGRNRPCLLLLDGTCTEDAGRASSSLYKVIEARPATVFLGDVASARRHA